MLTMLSEIYATLNDSPVVTLVFSGENFDTLRYVLGNEDITISGQTYEKSNFQVSLPESSNSGFSDIKIALCNVNNEVYEKLQSVIDNGIVLSATVDLRIPTTLVADWSMTLDVKGLAFNEDKVQITASANDILNCEFPKLRYSALTFPGLKYLK